LPLLPELPGPDELLPLPDVDGVTVGVLVAVDVGTGLSSRSYGLRAVGVGEGVGVMLRPDKEATVAAGYGTTIPFSSNEGVVVTFGDCAGVAVEAMPAPLAAPGGAALVTGCCEKLKFLAQAVKIRAQASIRKSRISP